MNMKKKFVVFAAESVSSGTAAALGNVPDVAIYDSVKHSTLPVHRHKGGYYEVGWSGNECRSDSGHATAKPGEVIVLYYDKLLNPATEDEIKAPPMRTRFPEKYVQERD